MDKEAYSLESGTGTYTMTTTVHPLYGATTWIGSSQWQDSVYNTGTALLDETDDDTGSFPASDNPNDWSDTFSWQAAPGSSGLTSGSSGPTDETGPPFGPHNAYNPYGDLWIWEMVAPALVSQSTTQQIMQYYFIDPSDDMANYNNYYTLTNEYTSQQFQTDVIATLPGPSAWSGDPDTYYGSSFAWRHLASDNSSFAVASGTYSFSCLLTGTIPYKFEWYEAFQPDDDPTTGYVGEQHITLTPREWDNAYQQANSQGYTIDLSTQTNNGVWYLVKMDVQELTSPPACQWRHAVGAGEQIRLTLQGLPPDISGSAQWTASPANVGTIQNGGGGAIVQTGSGAQITYTAGTTAGNVTITASLVGGATMSTSFAITTPTSVTATYVSSERFATGTVGAGMFVYWTLQPTNVSFGNLMVSESSCTAVNVTGFYKESPYPLVHNPSGTSYSNPTQDVGLHNYNWQTVRSDDAANFCDWCSSGPLSISTNFGGTLSGGYEWDIPFIWKLQSDTQNANVTQFPTTVKTTVSVNSSGTVTVTKVKASDTRSSNGSESHVTGP